MGILNYPRPGQRIAPATLREVLAIPVPLEFKDITAGRFEKLGDLDETVWQHASAITCNRLANLVLLQVKRSVSRLCDRVKSPPLPKLHRPLPLSALEIEVRTVNCLKRRFREDLRPLNDLCIRDLLMLPGFGMHALLDFLVSLESVIERPDQFAQLELEGVGAASTDPMPASELPSEFRVEISRFPRKGHRIAPRTLAHILDAPAKDRRMGSVKFLDLDESVWEKFEPKTCRKLAAEVICRVKKFHSALRSELGGTRLPMPRTKGKPAVLQLQRRTFNCLNNAGLLEAPARLAETTFRELFEMVGFGDICLVDLLCALEYLHK